MNDLRRSRVAPPPSGLREAVIPVFTETRLTTGSFADVTWTRLHHVAYPNRFHSSLKSRLTPASGAYPCVYLAPSAETAVAEIWGDQMVLEKGRGEDVFAIPKKKAHTYGFLVADSIPPVRLCDFTHGETLLSIGLDFGTLYSPDLAVTQQWAEAVAAHDARFDGIVYRSRHTGEECVVLWLRPGGRPLDRELTFRAAEPFVDSDAAYKVAESIGITLAFSV